PGGGTEGYIQTARHLRAGERATVRVKVVCCRLLRRRGGVPRVEARVADESGGLQVVWFRQAYMGELEAGARVWLHGLVGQYRGKPQLVNPLVVIVQAGESGPGDLLHIGGLVPIYSRIGKLGPSLYRQLVAAALQALGEVKESLPGSCRRRLGLIDRGEALRQVHRPPPGAEPELWNGRRSPAHRRLVCEEFLAFQTGLQEQRREAGNGLCYAVGEELQREVAAALPFELTRGQSRALREILHDMGRPEPMHRLLQGEVGSGKTAVAGCAMLVAALNGLQTALLVPTEIFAQQQAAALRGWANRLGMRVGCLTAGQPEAQRRRLYQAVASGDLSLIVGTHALLQPDLHFARLGLAVVDEQQRFGVRQRATLRAKGVTADHWPDLLVMTATPIPRSLALTLYGDLEVCTISDMPAGRQPVRTLMKAPDRWPEVLGLLRAKISGGGQAYVVAPRIASGSEATGAAVTLEAELQRQLPGVAVGLLHGALDPRAKLEAMGEFVAGRTAVLVATTIVEVGVDVPAATLMIVDHAERFGLAQLHQLRGRVGRGDKPATCVLLAHPPLTDVALARLEAMCDNHDGFTLAQRDLELRGPGEVLGSRQSGSFGLRIGDPFRDHEWMLATRREAIRLASAKDREATAYRRRLRAQRQRPPLLYAG
ncbi:MAG: ATP-dependent DNA helicase RecG, partial [Acidobacteriota bacterium]